MARFNVNVKSVDVRVARLEPDALIQAIGGFTRGPRRQIDGCRTFAACKIDCEAIELFAHTVTACRIIDHDVLDPRTHAGRNAERHQRQRRDHTAVKARDHHVGGGRSDHLGELAFGRRR